MRALVACHDLVLSGGLLRFERVAREIRAWGHELSYVTFSEVCAHAWESEFPIISIDEAMQQEWSVTMVPGAGFPVDTIRRFSLLNKDCFGYRVQHVLNDPRLVQHFLAVNKAFNPDLVVFNNLHWTPGSFTDFQARKFSILEGAVDISRFKPSPHRQPLPDRDEIVIGGLANKNPYPLLQALRMLPERFTVRLFGAVTIDLSAFKALHKAGRLRLVGNLGDEQLAGFYNEVDIVVHTEEFAGWANLVAEAMASGVPVICTRHGTASFAVPGETALVLNEISGKAIAGAAIHLYENPAHTAKMVANALDRIQHFDWKPYSRRLFDLCVDDGQSHYTYAPELGLHGKWPLAERLKDLDYVFKHCNGASVLDFGCAEGVVAMRCLERGARFVHGLELEASRVANAERLCARFPDAHYFSQANLDEWATIKQQQDRKLLPKYDIVLYLGIQHHLSLPGRITTLEDAVSMADRVFAIRTPGEVYRRDNVDSILAAAGFTEVSLRKQAQRENFGIARIFVRK